MDTQHSGSGKKRPWVVFNIIEKKGLQKPFWHRVGVAWPNQDGSFKVVLDSMPMGGEILVREDKEWDRPKGALRAAADHAETERVEA